MVNIALFGTSADPPTSAHQAILNWLAAHYDHVNMHTTTDARSEYIRNGAFAEYEEIEAHAYNAEHEEYAENDNN